MYTLALSTNLKRDRPLPAGDAGFPASMLHKKTMPGTRPGIRHA
jgi:hypothetical protein